jgi:uncharacterized membrane protein
LTSLKIATITFTIGLVGYALTMICSTLLHKLKKKYSFIIVDTADEIIIKNNLTTNVFNTVGHFFLYSLLTAIVVANSSVTNIYFQLLLIYSICLIVVSVEYYYRNKFAVAIDKTKQFVKVKGEEYSLKVFSEFEISDRSFWMTDDFDLYGLYIKSADNKTKLIYGYSLLKDIQQLKTEIETRLNSR